MKLVSLTLAAACATVSYAGSGGVLSDSDKTALLAAHNNYRTRVAFGDDGQTTAANMNEMAWDDALATVAKNYVDANLASSCSLVHNDNRNDDLGDNYELASFKFNPSDNSYGVGENLYMSSSTDEDEDALVAALDNWYAEYSLYSYSSDYNSAADHYTQMVWAETRYVGCAYALCDGDAGIVVACDYFKAGNWAGEYPYIQGDAGTACDSDRTYDGSTGLCAGCMSDYWTYCSDEGGWCSQYSQYCGTCDTSSTSSMCTRCKSTCNTCTADMITCSDDPTPSVTPAPTPADAVVIDLDEECSECYVVGTVTGVYASSSSLQSVAFEIYGVCSDALSTYASSYYLSISYYSGTTDSGFTVECRATINGYDDTTALDTYFSSDEFKTDCTDAVGDSGTVYRTESGGVTSATPFTAAEISVEGDEGKVKMSWWLVLIMVAAVLSVSGCMGFFVGRFKYKSDTAQGTPYNQMDTAY